MMTLLTTTGAISMTKIPVRDYVEGEDIPDELIKVADKWLKPCAHENQIDGSDYDYDSDVAVYITSCADCGAVYDSLEEEWHDVV